MIKILIIFLFLISSCTTNKVIKHHGINSLEKKQSKLIINETNKNDILKILGPPSTKSTFNNDVWIYIERKKTNRSIFKLGNQKIEKNNVVVLEINNKGILSKKEIYDIANMNKYKFSKKITNKKYKKDSYIYGVLSSLRDKIDAPIKRQKTKK